MPHAFVVALVGAESTGKTTLAADLAEALRREGREVAVVAEYLREFCDERQRTPRQDEQAGIAAEQHRRIQAAMADHDIVIADTTAILIAVYSDTVFGDTTLYPTAEQAHAQDIGLTLLTAIDLPWEADGLQRDGPHVRAPVDAKLRAALQRANCGYGVVAGHGPRRLEMALHAVRHALHPAPVEPQPRWTWHCDRCSDGACERHALLARSG